MFFSPIRRIACVLVLLHFIRGVHAIAAPALDGAAVKTGRVTIAIDASGLPAGITVPPRQDELPLDHREGGTAPTAEVLAAIGRGPLLRGAVRLEAIIDGKPVAATATEAAKPAAAGDAVRAAAKLAAGPLTVTTTADYRDTLPSSPRATTPSAACGSWCRSRAWSISRFL